ncbi:hypothetical protein ARMGADRAFT_589996 [Armillaria gallica]|uniref:Uncharacterized protein n=1 Tax=Armillaria gallica TaxID=47427 RepID=A0A2H3DY69_ARMGA|nr:hypothetical protein ARMGADRAFT_589996 [Armillaria gallica]
MLTMYQLSTHLPWFSATAGELSTLAMLSYPVAKRHVATICEATKRGGSVTRAYERLVLGSVGVYEAVSRLKAARTRAEWDRYIRLVLLHVPLSWNALKRIWKAYSWSLSSLLDMNLPVTVTKRMTSVGTPLTLLVPMAELGDVRFEKVWLGGGGGLEGV